MVFLYITWNSRFFSTGREFPEWYWVVPSRPVFSRLFPGISRSLGTKKIPVLSRSHRSGRALSLIPSCLGWYRARERRPLTPGQAFLNMFYSKLTFQLFVSLFQNKARKVWKVKFIFRCLIGNPRWFIFVHLHYYSVTKLNIDLFKNKKWKNCIRSNRVHFSSVSKKLYIDSSCSVDCVNVSLVIHNT